MITTDRKHRAHEEPLSTASPLTFPHFLTVKNDPPGVLKQMTEKTAGEKKSSKKAQNKQLIWHGKSPGKKKITKNHYGYNETVTFTLAGQGENSNSKLSTLAMSEKLLSILLKL